ncbi:hypothetical protein SLE2022_138790 [Rubroshorea leprosula]
MINMHTACKALASGAFIICQCTTGCTIGKYTCQCSTGSKRCQDLVHTLLKGLEKIAASANIPMLVCGDFNFVPGNALHALLAMGKIDPMHPDLVVDPLGILRPHSKLAHQLPLVCAYSSLARVGVGLELE